MNNLLDEITEPITKRVATGLSKIAMALRSHAWQEAGARGLTPTQGQILLFLRQQPDSASEEPPVVAPSIRFLPVARTAPITCFAVSYAPCTLNRYRQQLFSSFFFPIAAASTVLVYAHPQAFCMD